MVDPAVNRQLQPLIVASWHGHRDDASIPDPVRHVWQEKFRFRAGPQSPPSQSNVDLAILDSQGRVVYWFDGFPQSSPGLRESLSEYTARELTKGLLRLRSEERATRTNALILPDLSEDRGIRVFVSLLDDRMRAYRAPVVEVVPLAPADWKLLAWPPQKRRVNAAELAKWLSQVYPPGVMERTDPRTKVAYRIESVEGNLSLAPAGQDEKVRYAILSGNIRLTDEGQDDFSYTGKLDIVLTYLPDQPEPQSLRGVFEGSYPRLDRMLNRSRDLPLQAVFESRPN